MMGTAHQQETTYSPNGRAAERWRGIERTYTPDDVHRLRGSLRVEHTLARLGAERIERPRLLCFLLGREVARIFMES